MTSENLLIVCRSCQRKILMHNMRPDSSGENMICVDCYKRASPTKMMSISEAAAEHIAKTAPKKVEHAPEDMNKFICTSCKYKFSRKKHQEVTKCPYCGKQSVILDSGLGADKLLKDSLDRRFENW